MVDDATCAGLVEAHVELLTELRDFFQRLADGHCLTLDEVTRMIASSESKLVHARKILECLKARVEADLPIM